MSRRARRNKHRDKRVGHAEREEAAQLLAEHHSYGRLDVSEFDARMTAALTARTAEDLSVLFEDLPGFGSRQITDPRQVDYQPHLYTRREAVKKGRLARPWYAQWWWLAAGAGLAGLSLLHWSLVFWVILVWLVIGYPVLTRVSPPPALLRRRRGVQVHAVLTDWELGQVEQQLRMNRLAHAITMYRRFTGTDYREAEQQVSRMRRSIMPPGRGT